MDILYLLFNTVTVIFIATTMFTAGLGATISALWGVFADFPLLLLALLGNLAVIPLLGWGPADLLGLPTASVIALVLAASSLTAEFRMFNQEHTGAVTSPAPGSQVGQGRTELQVDAYNTSSHVVRVAVRIDGCEKEELRRTGKFSWSAPWDTRELKPGDHTAKVTAFDDAGNNWSTTSRFTIAPKADQVHPGADVPEFHGGALHTGVQPGSLGSGSLTNAWTHRSGATIGMSSPVVANGTAYIGTWDTDRAKGNGVDAVDVATGRTKWHFATDSLVQSTPVVHDGTVYVTEIRGTLTALDAATGAKKWSYTLPGSSETGRYDGYAYGGATVSGSAVYYFGYTTTGSHLVAVDTATGKELWNSPVDSGWWDSSTPTVVDGKVRTPTASRAQSWCTAAAC
ncbi:PQQ-binding-like beta-propeller repeat protein [Streptomyces sp. NPDC056309]|uniref:outer membrane protein assembly factor BamB family protein n=1 Tax=unclassified Streptomyces TaxID=2593676 RepID=UPI0035E16C95